MYLKYFFSFSKIFAFGLVFISSIFYAHNAQADDVSKLISTKGDRVEQTIGPSGLPLPRYVTLKASRVNMRVGPNQHKYPVKWSYQHKGLPVEIYQEYGNWRRIRDYDGATGWVNAALLSGRRAAIIAPNSDKKYIKLYREADTKSPVSINAEPGVIGKIQKCDGTWCRLEVNDHEGYISQVLLWGVYPDEKIDE